MSSRVKPVCSEQHRARNGLYLQVKILGTHDKVVLVDRWSLSPGGLLVHVVFKCFSLWRPFPDFLINYFLFPCLLVETFS